MPRRIHVGFAQTAAAMGGFTSSWCKTMASMEHDCDVENLTITARQVYKITDAKATSQQQKEAQKDNPWNTVVTLRSWKFKVVARQFFVQRSRGVEAIWWSKPAEKHQNLMKTTENSSLGVHPRRLKNRTCSQDGPRCFQERFWRGLGGLLGAPWEAQEGPKSMLGWCFFWSWQALV